MYSYDDDDELYDEINDSHWEVGRTSHENALYHHIPVRLTSETLKVRKVPESTDTKTFDATIPKINITKNSL